MPNLVAYSFNVIELCVRNIFDLSVLYKEICSLDAENVL